MLHYFLRTCFVLFLLLNLAHATDKAEAYQPSTAAPVNPTNTKFSEPRNAAIAALGTQNFIVGRMAKECYVVLKQKEDFVQKFVYFWQQKNRPYLDASAHYLDDFLNYIKNSQGQEVMQAILAEYSKSVRANGTQAAQDLLSKGNRVLVCRRFVVNVVSGKLDIKSSHPFYNELQGILSLYESQ